MHIAAAPIALGARAGYHALALEHAEMMGDEVRGEAKSANEFHAGLMPGVEFGKIGEAFGAYAEKLDDPAEVPAALARCVKEVRGGRSAILHARVTPL